MRRAVLSPAAASWLKEEIAYLAERDPGAARKLAARVRQARLILAEHPRIGRQGLIPGTRQVVVGAYVLTVRMRQGVVEVAAIRHGRQADARAPVEAIEDEPV